MADDDIRALLDFNAALRRDGMPSSSFGAPRGLPVGYVASRRPELCTLGLHRFFLSEATFTPQGVESLLLLPDTPRDDRGERIYYTPQAPALHHAFASNAEHRRPVRVVRLVSSSSAPRSGSVRRDGFRYDGLYSVAPVDEAATAAASGAAPPANTAPRFLLLRLPDQLPLPPGVGNYTRAVGASDDPATADIVPLQLYAEIFEAPSATTLPPLAEGWITEDAASGDLSLADAYRRLHAAREALLSQLLPQDAYALLKRSASNQVRLVSGLDLTH